jgi:hypothetical protein
LMCTANDCSSSVPSGAGFSTICDDLVTDAAACTQTCNAGYTDNNSGQGQLYKCALGTFSGTVLECFPFLASISGGSARTVSRNANFTLTALTNAPSDESTLLMHSWSCSLRDTFYIVVESNTAGEVWTVDASILAPNTEYTCTANVTLHVQEQTVTASTTIWVAPGSPPAVSITTAVIGKIDPGLPLKLLGCVEPTDFSLIITPLWLVTILGGDGSFQKIDLATTTGLQSNNLVVQAGELQPGRTYRFTLQVICTCANSSTAWCFPHNSVGHPLIDARCCRPTRVTASALPR